MNKRVSTEKKEYLTLDSLYKDDVAKVVGFDRGDSKLVSKLLAMGVGKGSEIKIIRFAPLGDPIHIRILGANFSLRKEEAKHIRVVKN